MSKTKGASKWPPMYKVTHRSGQLSYQVDLEIVDGRRKRVNFPTKEQAKTYGEQTGIARANEGTAAFSLPMDFCLDAVKANQLLGPHSVTILYIIGTLDRFDLYPRIAPS